MRITVPGDKPITIYSDGNIIIDIPSEETIDIVVGITPIACLLYDDFSDDVAAGGVNGTSAKKGTRVVTDVNAKMEITGGELIYTALSRTYSDPMYHLGAVDVVPGKIAVAKMMQVFTYGGTSGCGFGLYWNPTFYSSNEGILIFGDYFRAYFANILGPPVRANAGNIYYKVGVICRISGSYMIIDGKLVYIYNRGGRGGLVGTTIPAVINSVANEAPFKLKYFKVFEGELATPVASDGFSTVFGTSDGFGHPETWPYAVEIGDSQVSSVVDYLNVDPANICFCDKKGVIAQTLAQIEARFTVDVLNNVYDPVVVIIEGGVNDCGGKVSPEDPTTAMLTSVTNMVNAAVADGKVPVLVNISPWGTYVGWSAYRQGLTDTYNTALAAYAVANDILLADVYTALEDPANPDCLLPAYTSDGLHYTTAGTIVAAGVIKQQTNKITTGMTSARMGAGGGGKVWTAQAGTWETANNVAKAATLNGAGIAIATIDCGVTDIFASCNLVRSGGLVGNVWRYVDDNNYLFSCMDGTNFFLKQKLAATVTTIKTVAFTGASSMIKISIEGTAVILYQNDAIIVSPGTVDLFGGSTNHGLYVTDVLNTMDNFLVFDKSQPRFDKYHDYTM